MAANAIEMAAVHFLREENTLLIEELHVILVSKKIGVLPLALFSGPKVKNLRANTFVISL